MSKVTNLHRDLVAKMKGPASNACAVIIEGRHIPDMEMRDNGDVVEFIIDRRMSYSFPREWAYLAASFAASAMAVGAGYPSLNGDHKFLRPFGTPTRSLGEES